MTIETKYNIGDEVWVLDGLEPISREVLRIDIEVYNAKTIIEYDVMVGDVLTGFYEREIFPTKEELLKSL